MLSKRILGVKLYRVNSFFLIASAVSLIVGHILKSEFFINVGIVLSVIYLTLGLIFLMIAFSVFIEWIVERKRQNY